MTDSLYPLYGQHADLWPIVAPVESYRDEMREWVELIREALGRREELEVLDLGTGGGHHLCQLCRLWGGTVGGVATDISGSMLERVKSLVPRFATLVHDMTTLKLERRFPLVTVHDSFCYLRDRGQVAALFSTIASHLEPGGLALVKVDALAGEFFGPYRYLTTFEEPEREITLTHYEWDPDPTDSELEVIYLFLERRGGRVETREERHLMGLFFRPELMELWTEAGLAGRWVELERWDEERPNPVIVLSLASPSSANP